MDIATTKEPELITKPNRLVPNFFLTFCIEACPKHITISANVHNAVFLKMLGNLFAVTQNIMSNKKDALLESYPRKSGQIINAIMLRLQRCIGDLFIDISGRQPKQADSTSVSKQLVIVLEVREPVHFRKVEGLEDAAKYLKVGFNNFHLDDIARLVKVYKHICETSGPVGFIGPKSTESELDNKANRMINILENTMHGLLNDSYGVYLAK